jgi:heterodisulfide reductase subunit A-like polyferredoxin
MVRRRRTKRSYKKRIIIPVVSTMGGLALFGAMGGPKAVQAAMGGNIAGALDAVTGAMTSQAGKQALVKAAAGTLAAKLLLKNMPRSIGRLGPLSFTTS